MAITANIHSIGLYNVSVVFNTQVLLCKSDSVRCGFPLSRMAEAHVENQVNGDQSMN